jgi:hypothetical protein
MPGFLGAILSSKLANLRELQTDYGLEDAYDLFEVITIDRYNEILGNDHRN